MALTSSGYLTKVLIVTGCWLALCAWTLSNVGLDVRLMLAAVLVTGVWVLVWLSRLVLHGYRIRTTLDYSSSYPWLLEPALIASGTLLLFLVPLTQWRFAISEQPMLDYVERVRHGNVELDFEWTHPVTRLGLFQTSITEQLTDGTVRFITSEDGLLDKAGFAHSLAKQPMQLGAGRYVHLQGPWWYWYRSW